MTNTSSERSLPRRKRERRTGHLLPLNCGRYGAGHVVHWIQAKQSAGHPHRRGTLIEVDGYDITIDFGDEIKAFKNHDSQRLLEIVGIGRSVEVCEELVILRTRYGYLFSVAGRHLPWAPCEVAREE